MARGDTDYLQELTLHLRLAGMDGHQIGAVLEEVRDHLAESGEAPVDAFGDAEGYAQSLVPSSHRSARPERAMRLTRGDLIAAAAQLAGWLLLVNGVVAIAGPDDVQIRPGELVGVAVLVAGLVWPVWPATRAFAARRIGFVVPAASMMIVVGAFVGLAVVWTSPVLVALSPWLAIPIGAAVIVGCWLRAWRRGDPVRRPVQEAG